jgi:hypothetical protein
MTNKEKRYVRRKFNGGSYLQSKLSTSHIPVLKEKSDEAK